MRTMRRVALVLVGCVVASLPCWPHSSSGSGPLLGIAVGMGVAFLVMALYILSSARGNGDGVPPTRKSGERCPATNSCAPGALDHPRDHDRRQPSRRLPLAAPDRLRPRWLVQLRLDRQRRAAERRPYRSSAPEPRRRRPHPDDPRLRAVSAGDQTGPSHPERWRGDTWCLLVAPTPDGRSRLVSRWRQDWPKTSGTFVWSLITDPVRSSWSRRCSGRSGPLPRDRGRLSLERRLGRSLRMKGMSSILPMAGRWQDVCRCEAPGRMDPERAQPFLPREPAAPADQDARPENEAEVVPVAVVVDLVHVDGVAEQRDDEGDRGDGPVPETEPESGDLPPWTTPS